MDDTYISIPRRQIKNIKKKFVIDQNLSAPVNQNEAVGYMIVELEGKVLTTYKLFAMESIKEGSLYRQTLDSIYRYF
jgi:D-alanyl-D-alanine carboxypeptidase (penicillin-binding protein 5/6)